MVGVSVLASQHIRLIRSGKIKKNVDQLLETTATRNKNRNIKKKRIRYKILLY